MEKLLCANAITKTFKNESGFQKVLDSVSIEINEGDFVAVMGASGSGKSTLLYALSGMENIDEGEILFDGEKLSTFSDNKLSDVRREKMGFVFQQPTLLKNLNLLDNIILPQMRNHSKSVKELTKKAKELMEKVGIDGLEDRDVTQVSGGQLQRAGICRSLMNAPKILFADEPTGALNSKSSEEIMEVLSKIHQSGSAILIVTHDIKVAARAERVLFMQDGKIVSQMELFDNKDSSYGKNVEKIMLETSRLKI